MVWGLEKIEKLISRGTFIWHLRVHLVANIKVQRMSSGGTNCSLKSRFTTINLRILFKQCNFIGLYQWISGFQLFKTSLQQTT